MPLRDLLKRKDKAGDEPEPAGLAAPSQFTFIRTTTTSQEQIQPPQFPGDRGGGPAQSHQSHTQSQESPRQRPRGHSLFGKHSHSGNQDGESKTLSERLHLGSRSRSASTASVNVPADLPEIEQPAARSDEEQAQWEKRATLLASSNHISRSPSPGHVDHGVSDASGDVCVRVSGPKEIR
jgi:hypothetical protein